MFNKRKPAVWNFCLLHKHLYVFTGTPGLSITMWMNTKQRSYTCISMGLG